MGSGAGAVAAIVSASSRLAEASPKIRVFMEAGDEAERPPNKGDASLTLDVYPKDNAPGLSAVVKGSPATTLVLWRAQNNHITHAWVAPERDGFDADWTTVTEERLLESKAMVAVNELLALELPDGKDYWDFHFHNYASDPDYAT